MIYAQEVFRIISDNPGINGGEIVRKLHAEFDSDITIKNLNSVLNGLKRRTFDSIENRGSNGLSARWYVCVPEEPEPLPYLDEANRILREIKRIIPNQRAEWLAEQLEIVCRPK